VANTTADLAADLGVDEGDVDVLLELLDEQPPDLPDDLAGFLRDVLDPHGERTAPAGLYWPAADDAPRRLYGLGGPDPTATPDIEPR
jgi:hypothetical protein